MGKIEFWILVLAACCVDLSHQGGGRGSKEPEICVTEDDPSLPISMSFPDGNEQPQLSKVRGTKCYRPATQKDLTYTFYTRWGPGYGELLTFGNYNSLTSAGFNRSLPTIFVTHGFLARATDNVVLSIIATYLGFHDVNAIAVDWSQISGRIDYFVAKPQTKYVGAAVAEFLHFLHVRGRVDLSTVHLVGHSLGAHVMGIAGKVIRSRSLAIGRITGLDPAGIRFSVKRPEERLDSTDANFVDVIHTNTNLFGIKDPIGTVDFYPNGGGGQRGCIEDKECYHVCSHSRAWKYFAESISTDQFKAYKCRILEDAKRGNCDMQSIPAIMGHKVSPSTSGIFYLKTDTAPPFAAGTYPWKTGPKKSWTGPDLSDHCKI